MIKHRAQIQNALESRGAAVVDLENQLKLERTANEDLRNQVTKLQEKILEMTKVMAAVVEENDRGNREYEAELEALAQENEGLRQLLGLTTPAPSEHQQSK
eukprot:Colp12_sorted_trinity150504_noHs@11728